VSGRSVGDRSLPKMIERELTTHAVDPARLILEITETAAISNMDDALRFAQALGADAYNVRDAEDFERAWGCAIEGSSAGRPQVIVAHIDTTQIPPYYQPME